MRPDDIVGYSFKADLFCPNCIVPVVRSARHTGVAGFTADPRNAEESLDALASYLNIDRQNESSFDSGEFPKVVFRDQTRFADACGRCGHWLGRRSVP